MTDKKRRVAEEIGWDYFEPFGWMDSDGAVGGRQVDYNTPALFCDATERWLIGLMKKGIVASVNVRHWVNEDEYCGVNIELDNDDRTDFYAESVGDECKQEAIVEAVCQMLDQEH